MEAEWDRQRLIREAILNGHCIPPPFPDNPKKIVDNLEVIEVASRMEAFVDKEMHGC